jgi:hypothetical protein
MLHNSLNFFRFEILSVKGIATTCALAPRLHQLEHNDIVQKRIPSVFPKRENGKVGFTRVQDFDILRFDFLKRWKTKHAKGAVRHASAFS